MRTKKIKTQIKKTQASQPLDVNLEIQKIAKLNQLNEKIGKPTKKLKIRSPDLSIRINTEKRLMKLRVLQASIEAYNASEHPGGQKTVNEEINKAIEMYADGVLAKDFYDLNFKGIEDSLNTIIFVRNHSLINYIEKTFIALKHDLVIVDKKLNLLLRTVIKDESTINQYDYLKLREFDWMPEIWKDELREIESKWKLKPTTRNHTKEVNNDGK